MHQRKHERGEGKLGCIFGLLLVAAAFYVAFKVIPVKVAAADMRQTVIDQARSAGHTDAARIRWNILAEARRLELPLQENALKVERSSQYIKIKAEYTTPIEFPGYTWNWKHVHTAENPVF